ncbi:hypothetical protein QUB56_24895 [Microcoleus sp. AR_TQ3_B6]
MGRAAAGSLDEPVESIASRIDRPIVKPIDSKEIVPGVRSHKTARPPRREPQRKFYPHS